MRTPDATLLPPAPLTDDDRSLDEVGPLAILGAMVEHKRRSTPPPPPASRRAVDERRSDPAMPRAKRAPRSEGFLKAR